MAESRQESRTSDDAVKITRKKSYRLGKEKVLLKGLGKGLSLNFASNIR